MVSFTAPNFGYSQRIAVFINFVGRANIYAVWLFHLTFWPFLTLTHPFQSFSVHQNLAKTEKQYANNLPFLSNSLLRYYITHGWEQDLSAYYQKYSKFKINFIFENSCSPYC